MKQGPFEQRYRSWWTQLAEDMDGDQATERDFPSEYRRLCHLLAVAKSRHYSPDLVDELQAAVLAGHLRLHRSRSSTWRRMANYILVDFPVAVRREWRALAVASLAFYLPGLIMFFWVQWQPEMIYTLMDGEAVEQIEQMYQPGTANLGRENGAASDSLMFGFYIRNNTSIGLQTLAGGLLGGTATLAFLIFNGLFFGGLAGHMVRIGLADQTFFPFVSGHAAMELTAIVISGAAGLIIGKSLLAPGRYSRGRALKRAGRRAVDLLWGLMIMFLAAAAIEAFWSALPTIPKSAKYAFGASQWLLLGLYFLMAGRGRERQSGSEYDHAG